jgi:putative membrane protein
VIPEQVAAVLWSGWDAHPSLLIAIGGLAGSYVAGVVIIGRRLGERLPASKGMSFAAGIAVLLLALQSPLHHLSDDYLFSAHMLQHQLLTLVAPPFLLLGTPAWLIEAVVPPRWRPTFLRGHAYPIVAFGVFNIFFAFIHFPSIYDTLFGTEVIHRLTHAALFLAALVTWLPLFSPAPSVVPRISQPAQMLYCFVQTIPGSLVGSLLTLSDRVMYRHYGTRPLELGISPIADQQFGGLLMWVVAGSFFLLVLTVIFFVWADREEARAYS